MKKGFFVLAFLLLTSCGTRTIDDAKPASVVGVWDSTVCQDRIALNDDLTFVWDDQGTNMGSYWLDANQIDFEYSNKLTEVYQYTVTDKELTLLRGNAQYKYVKVPPIYKDGRYVVPPPIQKPTTFAKCMH